MSAGFYRSPLVRCPSCSMRLHPGLVGDLRAHAEASGEPVRFACIACGTQLSIGEKRPRPENETKPDT